MIPLRRTNKHFWNISRKIIKRVFKFVIFIYVFTFLWWKSMLFYGQGHFRCNMGIISAPGSFAHHLRSGIICCPRIICRPRRTERRTEEGGRKASNKTHMIKQLKMASLLVEISSKSRRKIFGKVSSKIEKKFIFFSLLPYDFFNEIFGIPKLFAHSCITWSLYRLGIFLISSLSFHSGGK